MTKYPIFLNLRNRRVALVGGGTFQRFVLWITLILIILLTMSSVYGAFLGADRAKVFFNSIPLGVYWGVFLITLVFGFIAFKRFRHVPALLIIHLGCIAILIGGLWGSDAGKAFQRAKLGRVLIPNGQMMLMNGQMDNRVHLNDVNEVRELPFALTLDEFRIEYYEPGKLYIYTATGKHLKTISAFPNTYVDIGPPFGSVQVVRTFKNFRIASQAYDDPGPGSNPAVELLVTPPAVQPQRHFVFELHAGHADQGPLIFRYQRTISGYISDLKVLKDGKVVKKKSIEVNHPLYYGGYHFYQSSYGQDPQTGEMYTVLSVSGSSGLSWVFGGYLLLCLGVAWQCWFHRLKPRNRQEDVHGR